MAQQLLWWDQLLEVVRRRLEKRDEQMVREYLRRTDLATHDLRFAFSPGDRVILRQKIPGKL